MIEAGLIDQQEPLCSSALLGMTITQSKSHFFIIIQPDRSPGWIPEINQVANICQSQPEHIVDVKDSHRNAVVINDPKPFGVLTIRDSFETHIKCPLSWFNLDLQGPTYGTDFGPELSGDRFFPQYREIAIKSNEAVRSDSDSCRPQARLDSSVMSLFGQRGLAADGADAGRNMDNCPFASVSADLSGPCISEEVKVVCKIWAWSRLRRLDSRSWIST